MKNSTNVKATVDGKEVIISLTKEQLKEIKKQIEKPFDFKKLKTFKDCCEAIGITTEEFYSRHKKNKNDLLEIKIAKLRIINKAINNGWTPDWNDGDQPKYYPYFSMGGSSGFCFSGAGYYYCSTLSSVGSRLCYESKDQARYAGEQFVEVYQGMYLIDENDKDLKDLYK